MNKYTLAAIMTLFLSACARDLPVVGCSTPIDSIRKGPALVGLDYGMHMTSIPLDAIQFGDADLARRIAIQMVHANRTPTNTVHVAARLVNCGDRPLTVRMRTSFMNGDQLPTEPTSAWRTLILPPRATTVYEENSTSVDVNYYLIELANN